MELDVQSSANQNGNRGRVTLSPGLVTFFAIQILAPFKLESSLMPLS